MSRYVCPECSSDLVLLDGDISIYTCSGCSLRVSMIDILKRKIKSVKDIPDKKESFNMNFNELRQECPWVYKDEGLRCRPLYNKSLEFTTNICMEENCAFMYWLSQGEVKVEKEESILDLIEEFGHDCYNEGSLRESAQIYEHRLKKNLIFLKIEKRLKQLEG